MGRQSSEMRDVPEEIHDRVRSITCRIVDATLADDHDRSSAFVQELREYYEELAAAGRSDPFVTETLADFLDDRTEAIPLYELSLEQALRFPGEPRYTKKLSLAETLLGLGQRERGLAYLSQGRAEAVCLGDDYWIGRADEIFEELAA